MSQHSTEHQRKISFSQSNSDITHNDCKTLWPQVTVTQTLIIEKESESVASDYNKFQADGFTRAGD